MPDAFPILFHDAHLVAVDKPSGWLVHRTMLDRHETRFVVQVLRDQIGSRVYPAHRLDRGTSGVLLFALNPITCAQLTAQFENRQVRKTYLAVVRGHPPLEGVIDHPLSRQFDAYEFRDTDTSAATQDAVTRYRRLATVELPYAVDRYPSSRYALVELTPETGRRHQLRRHLKHLAHPIIGDATYGKGKHNRLFAELFGSRRMLLACTALELTHPENGERLLLKAPPSGEFMSVLEALGWARHVD